jgi:hypothetical protein
MVRPGVVMCHRTQCLKVRCRHGRLRVAPQTFSKFKGSYRARGDFPGELTGFIVERTVAAVIRRRGGQLNVAIFRQIGMPTSMAITIG